MLRISESTSTRPTDLLMGFFKPSNTADVTPRVSRLSHCSINQYLEIVHFQRSRGQETANTSSATLSTFHTRLPLLLFVPLPFAPTSNISLCFASKSLGNSPYTRTQATTFADSAANPSVRSYTFSALQGAEASHFSVPVKPHAADRVV